MNLKTKFFLPIIFGMLIFAACNRQSVKLDFTNAKDEVPLLGNFTFRFSNPLVKDSMLNVWDSIDDYITFTPKIRGRFRWNNVDELVFSPEADLLPATTYKATFNKILLKHSKFSSIKNADDISFHTPNLILNGANFMWTLADQQSNIPTAMVELNFNYKVNPASLKEKLKIEIDGNKTDYVFVSESASENINIKITGLKAEDKNYDAKIIIDKGIVPETGSNPTTEDISYLLSIQSPFDLSIQNIESEHDGTEGIVTVKTSQLPLAENLSSFIRINPQIKFTTELTESGFVIRSEGFTPDQTYSLTILKDLKGNIGGILKEDYNNNLVFGEAEPSIAFTNSKGVYLSKRGGKNLEVKITGIKKVKLIISKIYENNLLSAISHGYSPNTDNDNNNYYDEENTSGYLSTTYGDVIYEKEIETQKLPKSNAGRLLNLSQFEDRLQNFKGIYHVSIRSTEDYWQRDNRFISLSDIGLIAKMGTDKITVFANSIKDATPMNGVKITVLGSNNQLVGSGNTNADGTAEITFTKNDFNGFKPVMILAKTNDDFNYLPFSNTIVNTSRFDVGGKNIGSSDLDAFIYPERDIYRPGERLNFSVIVRDKEWKCPGEIPVKMKLLLPNGKELKVFRKTLNEQGSAEGNVDISIGAITGSYSLEVYTGNDVLLGTKNFMIEEFVPDRIKVEIKSDKTTTQPGDDSKLNITATNLFGPPAADRNYECEIQLKQKYFYPANFDGFDFSLSNNNTEYEKIVKTGKTDAQGKAEIIFNVNKNYFNSGLLEADCYATVFDETGRPVSRKTSIDVATQPAFFGVKTDGYYYYSLNKPINFVIAAVNKDGAGTNATATVKVIKHDYKTVLSKSGSYYRYESQADDKVVDEKQLNINTKTNYFFTPTTAGNYELEIFYKDAKAYVSKPFYSYGDWGFSNASFEVNTEGTIDISLDKKSYYTGETAKVLFKTPFNGKLLITTETDKVQSTQYIQVENRTASINLKIGSKDLPNIYISATLIKPHDLSDIPLTVAHGYASAKVDERSRKIPVEIIAQKSSRSHSHQKIKIKATPNTFVTLAAVDNGVLQITNFATPNPYDYFYQKRALGITSFDIYPLLFPEVRARLSSTGGDGNADMNKRTNPMPAKRVKIVSYWSGIAKTNSSGEANFEFDVAQFSGELRLMAVAYQNQNFGSSENTMKIADPIVISTPLPRFLSPGDTVLVPINLTNTTKSSTNVKATITANGPIKIIGSNSQSISIADNSEARTNFKIVADPTVAIGKVTITAINNAGEKFVDETEIGVRPAGGLQKISASGILNSNSAQHLHINTADFMPNSVDYELFVGRSPIIEIADQLKYLVEYPYGCTEQTVSAAFPQLYYSDLADLVKKQKADKMNANTNVMEAIRKIKMRQLYNGAITLWDNQENENWWATVYAAHFLVEAKKAGFDVDDNFLNPLLNYISNRLKNKEQITYYFNGTQSKKIAPKEVAYSLYVLALAGHQNISAMNYYKLNRNSLSLDCKYLLAAAYGISGDKKSYAEILPNNFGGEESVTQTGGSFYSAIRDEAVALNAMLEVDANNAQAALMAKHLVQKLKTKYYLSTQERAFSFLALGKMARQNKASTSTAIIKSKGKTIGSVNDKNFKANTAALQSNDIDISTAGNGNLYYYWVSEGISKSGNVKEEDNFIKVRKQFYDRFGKPLNGKTFKQNDLIIVGITLEEMYNTAVQNIVITDMLPAGFEIENSRTKEIPGMDWIKNESYATATDVRDDRINLFVDLNNNKQTYYYAVRAVSPGTYKMGPVSADAMYNGEYHSYNGAGFVKIIK